LTGAEIFITGESKLWPIPRGKPGSNFNQDFVFGLKK